MAEESKYRIAYVEDDDTLRANITEMLEEHGYAVEQYASQEAAVQAFKRNLPHLALLDVRLGRNESGGLDLCSFIRAQSATVPIVMLTGLDQDRQVEAGFERGADDYITKATSANLLIVRIRALLRRVEAYKDFAAVQAAGQSGLIFFDERLSQAFWKGQRIPLKPLAHYWELKALASNPGKVLSHRDLKVAAKIEVEDNTIIAHIKQIRDTIRRLDPDFDCIRTERSRGYRWVC